ncbi:hypothetical protein [Kitasatospora purpeofusca]|uniref:hypothetical protein n=1 Tax=Kitasatospora purpeofusca TaxID=67352 RepID=UPI0012FEADAF|nr:hypothetical protein [Kitasatospora purpeofusca]
MTTTLSPMLVPLALAAILTAGAPDTASRGHRPRVAVVRTDRTTRARHTRT